ASTVPGANCYIVSITDAAANYDPPSSATRRSSDLALQSLEATFNEDLNGDGTIGLKRTTLASNGVTTLLQVANRYELAASSGTGPFLGYQGNPATVREFDAVVPVGAVRTATGYIVS